MAKKKRKERKERRMKRRNAGGLADPPTRRKSKGSSSSGAFKHVLAGLGGGALGALAGGLAVKSGANPSTVSLLVLAGGAAGVAMLPGTARYLALGFGGFGAGQLALGVIADKKASAEEKPKPEEEATKKKPQAKRANAAPSASRAAFIEARRRELAEALGEDDEDFED